MLILTFWVGHIVCNNDGVVFWPHVFARHTSSSSQIWPMGGICARAIYVYPLTFFCLNYWRYTLNCLRDAQLFIVCPFDWRFEAISLSNDETIIKLHTHPSWVHPVTPFSRVITGVLASFLWMRGWRFFAALKLPNVGPILITEWLIAIVLFGGGLALLGGQCWSKDG